MDDPSVAGEKPWRTQNVGVYIPAMPDRPSRAAGSLRRLVPASRLPLALVVALLASCSAFAQMEPGSIEVGVGAGRFFGGAFARGSTDLFDHRVGADDDILKGLWVAAQLSRDWGLEFAVRRTETHLVEPQTGVAPYEPTAAVFIPATVELLGVRSFRYGNFVPYLGAGIGFMNVEIDTEDPAVRDVNRICLSLAAGARFYAVRWLGFRVDLRGRATYLGTRGLGEDTGWTDSGRWLRNGELLGGVFVSFGGLGGGSAAPAP